MPDPQLFIIVNGVPTKNKIVWQTLVDVNAIKQAIQKLKEINWLYKNVDDASLDDVSKKVVEVVEKPSSTMLEKVSDVDLAAFQSYTIRSLDQHTSPVQNIDHYKMLNVKEKPIESRQSHLDVMCFPTLSPLGSTGNSTHANNIYRHQNMPSLGYSTKMGALEKMPSMYSFCYGIKK